MKKDRDRFFSLSVLQVSSQLGDLHDGLLAQW
jgi:hypothetical protein